MVETIEETIPYAAKQDSPSCANKNGKLGTIKHMDPTRKDSSTIS